MIERRDGGQEADLVLGERARLARMDVEDTERLVAAADRHAEAADDAEPLQRRMGLEARLRRHVLDDRRLAGTQAEPRVRALARPRRGTYRLRRWAARRPPPGQHCSASSSSRTPPRSTPSVAVAVVTASRHELAQVMALEGEAPELRDRGLLPRAAGDLLLGAGPLGDVADDDERRLDGVVVRADGQRLDRERQSLADELEGPRLPVQGGLVVLRATARAPRRGPRRARSPRPRNMLSSSHVSCLIIAPSAIRIRRS